MDEAKAEVTMRRAMTLNLSDLPSASAGPWAQVPPTPAPRTDVKSVFSFGLDSSTESGTDCDHGGMKRPREDGAEDFARVRQIPYSLRARRSRGVLAKSVKDGIMPEATAPTPLAHSPMDTEPCAAMSKSAEPPAMLISDDDDELPSPYDIDRFTFEEVSRVTWERVGTDEELGHVSRCFYGSRLLGPLALARALNVEGFSKTAEDAYMDDVLSFLPGYREVLYAWKAQKKGEATFGGLVASLRRAYRGANRYEFVEMGLDWLNLEETLSDFYLFESYGG